MQLGRIRRRAAQRDETQAPARAIDVLAASGPVVVMDGPARTAMTVGCRDADVIPKVAGAGDVVTREHQQYQRMHEGTLVELGGYHGDWMAEVITQLRGHHEPQEELAFHEVIKRVEPGATMIELGSFWAYYSLWFARAVPGSRVLCCEPDPANLDLGHRNAAANDVQTLIFVHAAASSSDGEVELALESTPETLTRVTARSVDSLMDEHELQHLSLLHCDVQGAELDVLQGAERAVRARRIRFVCVSTHHHVISDDPDIHARCLDWLLAHGAHVICEHSVGESFSGDGLIVASFDERDRDFHVPMSYNRASKSLFRTPEHDLAILMRYVDSAGTRE